jgi:hypothetical protein
MGSVGSLGSYRKFVLAFGPRTTYNTKRIEIHKSLNINKKSICIKEICEHLPLHGCRKPLQLPLPCRTTPSSVAHDLFGSEP